MSLQESPHFAVLGHQTFYQFFYRHKIFYHWYTGGAVNFQNEQPYHELTLHFPNVITFILTKASPRLMSHPVVTIDFKSNF